MTAEVAQASEAQVERGRAIMLSYRELVEIKDEMAQIRAMLISALALQGRVDNHETRIRDLEIGNASKAGSRGVWKSILFFIGGMASALIGGGALEYLPKILGSLH